MEEIYRRRRTNIVPIEPISQCNNRKIKKFQRWISKKKNKGFTSPHVFK
jgi:hypothetical protein